MKSHVETKPGQDRAVILAVIREFGPLSRVQIHQITHLRTAAVSLLTRELLEEGKLVEAGLSDNPAGRKQVLLELSRDLGFVVGIELGAESVIAMAMDACARPRAVIREATCLDGGIDSLIEQLFRCTRTAISQAGLGAPRLLGIGIADPALVNRRDGISVMSSVIDFWRDVPIVRFFEKEFGVFTMLETSMRVKAIAERVLGSGESADDMIYVGYGAGIGAGAIVNGRPLDGHRFSAGEFGHTHVIEGGPPCRCGSLGCLEAIAAAPALAVRFRQVYSQGVATQALALAEGDPAKVTGWTVLQAAKAGDKICTAIVEEMGRSLGMGLANLVNLFNPAVIVLDQRLELAGSQLLDQLKRIVRMQALAYATEDLVFRFGTLGDQAGVLGAGLLVLEKLFEIPALKPPKFLVDRASVAALVSRRRKHREALTAKQ